MPVLSINPSKRTYNSTSTISASALNQPIEPVTVTSALLGQNIKAENEDDERLFKYLGLDEITKAFNKTIEQYNKYYEIMSVGTTNQLTNYASALQAQADVQTQDIGRVTGEVSRGLSTGAQVQEQTRLNDYRKALDQQITQQVDELQAQMQQSINESYAENIENVATQYQAILKQYNEAAQEVIKYGDTYANAIMEYLARSLNSGSDIFGTDEQKMNMWEYLESTNMLNSLGNGEYELTELGRQQLDAMLNRPDAKEDYDKLAEIVGEKMYGEVWSTLSAEKKAQYEAQYLDWLNQNFDLLKVRNLSLFTEDDQGNILVDNAYIIEPKYSGDAYNMYNLGPDLIAKAHEAYERDEAGNIISEGDQKKFDKEQEQIKNDINNAISGIVNGKIVQDQNVVINHKVYKYSDGVFYDTGELDGSIAADTMTVDIMIPEGSPFKNSNRRDMEPLLEAAKNGQLPDGAWILIGPDGSSDRETIGWVYSNNGWTRHTFSELQNSGVLSNNSKRLDVRSTWFGAVKTIYVGGKKLEEKK